MVQNARDWYCNSHEKRKEKKKGKGERDKRPICIKEYEIANYVQQKEKTDEYHMNAAYPKTDSQALTTHHDIS